MGQTDILQAADWLRKGGLVIFPTETVYGLGADAMNPTAIERVFSAKGRPCSHPLIVHIAEIAELTDWAETVPSACWELVQHCWPGPCTVVLKKRQRVLSQVTGGQQTVAVRVPAHPLTQQLLRISGRALVGPSANRFTRISPTTAQAAAAELGGQVDYILDGGAAMVGIESTIVDFSHEIPRIRRLGAICADEIARVLSIPLELLLPIEHALTVSASAEGVMPGNHALHYAPHQPCVMLTAEALQQRFWRFQGHHLPLACLLHQTVLPTSLPCREQIFVLTLPSEPTLYARGLYAALRQLDQPQFRCILIEAVPDTIAWQAINDRLRRASSIMGES